MVVIANRETILSYLPPFDVVKRSFELSTSKGQLMATASYENIIKMIRLLISAIDVDEVWYLDTYPDVAQAVRQGQISSAKEHFINNGYFEGRLPSKVTQGCSVLTTTHLHR